MKTQLSAVLAIGCVVTLGCTTQGTDGDQDVSVQPPIAAQQAKELEAHGDLRVDEYFWLRERENPEVIAYLEAENA
jgi:oligopeptidase B